MIIRSVTMNNLLRSFYLTIFVFVVSFHTNATGNFRIDLLNTPSGDTSSVQSAILQPDEIGSAIFREKLDSMANSWYIRNMFNSGDNPIDLSVRHQFVLSDSLTILRLRKIEAAIELSYNSVVRDYIETIVNRRPTITEIILGLSAYYFPIFEEVLDKYGLPLELKYLAIIESALNPRAVSRAGAVGLWQFMYGTAKNLSLEVSTLIDERRDVIKSTEAAAKYLLQLYQVYQNWNLVIAAYNCGPGNVNKAIDRAGGKTDYWKIYFALPRETREFVPAYIATTYIMNYYKEHQLTPRYPSLSLHTDTIMINKYLNLKQVSKHLPINIETIRDLNPMYRRDIIPGTPEKGYPLRIPVDLVASFIEKADSIYINEKTTAAAENTAEPTKIAYNDPDLGSIEGKTRILYTVKEGDNPGFIADWFDISVAELKYWHRISRNLIRTGQKMAIYVPNDKTDYYKKINNLSFNAKQELSGHAPEVNKTVPVSQSQTAIAEANNEGDFIYYTVQNGDNFWTIAKKYPGVSNIDIMQINNISDARSLKIGQKLKIKPKT
jgi:membrane-bound lytic murein transglycosylase D